MDGAGKRQPGEPLGVSRISVLGVVAACALAAGVWAQMPETDVHCVPVEERAGRELGCFVLATTPVGKLRGISQYWYLDAFTSTKAAQRAQGSRATVVAAAGKTWLFTIAPGGWQASGGERIAEIGPLKVGKTEDYTAVYMEAVFEPGMKSGVHRHAGPEAWYVLEGEQCLETPGGTLVARAGQGAIVPAGPPMQLTGTGTGKRHALVLILHDSSQPFTIPVSDWTPTGACTK
jgi:quercetin dioxygenase-like cupin family protein